MLSDWSRAEFIYPIAVFNDSPACDVNVEFSVVGVVDSKLSTAVEPGTETRHATGQPVGRLVQTCCSYKSQSTKTYASAALALLEPPWLSR